MDGNSTATITFKIDGDVKNFQILAKDAENLKKVLGTTASEAKELGQKLLDMGQAAEAFRGMETFVRGIENAFSSLSAEFNETSANETRLAQSMKMAMGATQEQVDAIISLTDAQEELGVVDGRLQISAAQQLAKFLRTTESLQMLIPLMNDMAAQQYGVATSEQNLMSIATQLGKVLNGQTEALQRSGYVFSDAQKEVLLYGTEAEKVSVLVEVIGAKVRGMNAELGKTDAGKMLQFDFILGHLREKIGSVLTNFMPFVSMFAQLTTGVNGFLQLRTSVQAFSAALKSTGIAKFMQDIGGTTAVMLGLSNSTTSTVATFRRFITATGSATAALKAMRAATAGVFGVVGLLAGSIVAFIGHISKQTRAQREAAEAAEAAAQAERELYSSVDSSRAELEAAMSAIKNFNGTQEEQTVLIEQLNSKWGDAFGHYDRLGGWYDTLATKIDIYCDKLAREIELEQLRSSIKSDTLLAKQQRGQVSKIPEKLTQAYGLGYTTWEIDNPAYEKAVAELEATEARIADSKNRMAEIFRELSSMEAQLSSASGETMTMAADSTGNVVGNASKDIAALEQSIQRSVEVSRVFGSELSEEDIVIEGLRSGITDLIQKYSAKEEAVRMLINRYWELVAARAKSKTGDKLPELTPVTGLAEVQSSSGLAEVQSSSGLAESQTDGQEPIVDVDQFTQVQTVVEGLAGAMRNLSGAVGEGAAQWLQWVANVLSAVGAAIPQLKLLTAANRENANASAANAAAQAGASVASTPFVGAVLAAAAIASVVTALSSVPKFAVGGLAYGPTLGLFGEYPGAARNPEVVAPLDRLRSMLRSPEDIFGHVEFEIRGDRLVGVLNRYGSKMRRS